MSEPISLAEAAAFVGVSEPTMRRAARNKTLHTQPFGKRSYRTTRQAALDWKNNPEFHKTAHKKYRLGA